jgi:hypothetical protein
MSKAICSYPFAECKAVIARRVRSSTMGLGYWAAMDAQKKEHVNIEEEKKKKEEAETTS